MCSTLCKVRSEAVSPDVFHLVLVWQRWHGTLWILFAELFIEKDKVCESTTDFHGMILEGCKISLLNKSQSRLASLDI